MRMALRFTGSVIQPGSFSIDQRAKTPSDDTEQFEIWRALAAGLKSGDGGNHLLTFHPRGGDDLVSLARDVHVPRPHVE